MDNQNNQKKKNENNFKKKTTTKKNEVKFKNFEDNDKQNLKKKTNVINGHNKSLKNMLKDKEKANENNISNNINNKNKSKIDFNNNNNKNKSINININSKKDNRINIKNEMNGKTRQTLQNNFILSQNPNNNNKNPSLMILKNIENTTYINSIIRIISNIIEISNFYLKNLEKIKNNMNNMPISFFYSRIIFHLFFIPSEKSYSLDKLYGYLSKHNCLYKDNNTKDAIDFLIYFINKLHEEIKNLNGINNHNKNNNQNIDFYNFDNYKKYLNENENTKILEKLCWINKKAEKCWGCEKEKITFQKFLTYDLDFEDTLNETIVNNKHEISVLDCIKHSSGKKDIYNIFCYNCNKKNNFERISSIYFSSKYLLFLIRGMENKGFINKIKGNNINIKIDDKLDITLGNKNIKLIYSLYGLILYDTEKMEYISYSISPTDGKWYKFINESINQVELNDFINENYIKIFPVILLYKIN